MDSETSEHLDISTLRSSIEGEVFVDQLHKSLYATDASIYRQYPLGVVFPKGEKDLIAIVKYADKHKISLIPRAAGTSLAGQCVGKGLVVDVSKHMNNIIELNVKEKWVRVQPGVIRDELNAFLAPHGLLFGPNTSTANRCMIGGMVGNNSCGSSSIVHGSTRDHTLSLRTVLSDSSVYTFEAETSEGYLLNQLTKDKKGDIYERMKMLLDEGSLHSLIQKNFPKPEIKRRNTGYAIDLLAKSDVFGGELSTVNFCDLLSGSEGTLALTSEIKLNLSPLPPEKHNIVCAHFESIKDSMMATVVAMEHKPHMCELMDKIILDCTKSHTLYSQYRWWVNGDPKGVLMIEVRGTTDQVLKQKTDTLIADLNTRTSCYATPIIPAEKSYEAWDLRKAGLGLLANLPGEGRAVACIEDTAVALDDLPAFIEEFEANMIQYGQQPIYYAHAGDGEIHLRPVLDLKNEKDRQHLFEITKTTAELVKKYRGSLSGEHGDGRVRAPFIPLVLGDEIYQILKKVKHIWDPKNIFNPGKIVDAPSMTEDLRVELNEKRKSVSTAFRYENNGGLIGAIEACNGSGDCRKLPLSGGTMCPSYQATRNEKDSTRGRANVLREFLQKHPNDLSFDHPELKEVMDLCLSCKGCTAECPSNVDMSKIKAEYQYQLHKEKGLSLKDRLISENYTLLKMGSLAPSITNFLLSNRATSSLIKKGLKMSPHRSIPRLAKTSLRNWYKKNYKPSHYQKKTVFLFCDEFTDLLDTSIGIKAIELLKVIGYDVKMVKNQESGRAHISKGVLDKAQKLANENVRIFRDLITAETPLLGIEPSAILTFRDEYPSLVESSLQSDADTIAGHCYTVEEFLIKEVENGHIDPSIFDNEKRNIHLHAHCHQKALGSVDGTAHLLSLPLGNSVTVIPSGCCGMAGSFGYDIDHYKVSMEIGELVLFPAVRATANEDIIVAPGTSCRHQIKDGTNRQAIHPIELLYNSLAVVD